MPEGRKSSPTEFEPAKLAKIEVNLARRGVAFLTGAEGARLCEALGAEALYIPEAGRPGIIVLGIRPSRAAVIEELIHLGQHRNRAWGLIDDVISLEIEAQICLIKAGERLGWTDEELNAVRHALEIWKSRKK